MSGPEHNPGTKLFIGNLPTDVREDEVRKLCDKFGPIRAMTIKAPANPQAPAYAFVEMENAADAEEVLRQRNGVEFGNNRINVELAKGRGVNLASRGPPKRSGLRVRVHGLPDSASWQDIKDHFRSCGDVGYADVVRTHGQPAYGVVELLNQSAYDAALSRMDGTSLGGRHGDGPLRVEPESGAPPMDRGAPPPYESRGAPPYDSRGPPPSHYDSRGPPPSHYDSRGPPSHYDRGHGSGAPSDGYDRGAAYDRGYERGGGGGGGYRDDRREDDRYRDERYRDERSAPPPYYGGGGGGGRPRSRSRERGGPSGDRDRRY